MAHKFIEKSWVYVPYRVGVIANLGYDKRTSTMIKELQNGNWTVR